MCILLCVQIYTHIKPVYEREPVGDNQSAESVEDARLLGTNGMWCAGRGWELMVELSGCGSANGKWEVIRQKRLVWGSPSGKQSGEPASPLPHLSSSA